MEKIGAAIVKMQLCLPIRLCKHGITIGNIITPELSYVTNEGISSLKQGLQGVQQKKSSEVLTS